MSLRGVENLQNKRQQKRFIKSCKVEFTVDDLTLRGISSDFSLKGLFLGTNHACQAGTVLDIVIHLPDGTVSKVKGKTVRSSRTPSEIAVQTPGSSVKNGMGIEIMERDANYLHLIRSLL
jgi:hypothetical protein